MRFSLADQTIYFLCSILFGLVISALYDVFKLLRLLGFTKLWQMVLWDVLYFLLTAFMTVMFALPFNRGAVRYFVIFGEALGFFTYRFTLGSLTTPVFVFLIRVFRKIFKKSLEILRKISNKLLKLCECVVYNTSGIIYKTQNIVFKKKRNKYEHKKRN